MKSAKYIYLIAALLFTTVSCNDDFLEEKRDLSGTNEEVFRDPLLASAYVDYVYGLFLPANNGTPNVQSQANAENGAYNNAWTLATDELAGENDWNKEWASIAYTNNHAVKYFGQRVGASIANNVWTRMKEINIFLTSVDKYELTDAVKNPLKGQLLFWRAYQYFELVKLYGGVPIVLVPQNPIVSEGSGTQIQRSSTAATFDQIVSDLDEAIKLLPGKWTNAADWGRITSGAAAALKGRALLTYASPQFNRSDDKARWQKAYDANLAAKTLLETNGFGLYKTGGTTNGVAWSNMFTAEVNNPEAVFIFGFNNVASGNPQRNSGWEQAVRSKEILGAGSISPTKQIFDSFPMKDGKMPGSSTYTYDAKKFYKNRDPRFAKTYAFNGALWPYKENTAYRQWTYMWNTKTGQTKPDKTTETKGANSSGIYLAKASNPAASNTTGNFAISGTDYIELRFAEVLLNLAESAIGIDKVPEGLASVQLVRERAGIENKDGSYGLSGITTRDQAFGAVLNERKIEFAYECKRFWDLRRWMLYNNDFGTCTRLGIAPLNGTRRTGIYIIVKTPAGPDYIGTADPLLKPSATGTAPLIDRDATTYPAGVTTADGYTDYLYDNYFRIADKDDLDPTSTANWKFRWYNEYYFFGINQTVLSASAYLLQTKGWNSLGGAGTFDPLQ